MAQKNDKKSGYPIQNTTPAYPQQQQYFGVPQQTSAYPTQQQPQYYYPTQTQPQNQVLGYPTQQQQPSYGIAPPPYPGTTNYPPQQQHLVHGSFDSSARFHPGSNVTVPPPPPGVMPTAAQIATSQGKSVVMTKPKANWIAGEPDGGYTF